MDNDRLHVHTINYKKSMECYVTADKKFLLRHATLHIVEKNLLGANTNSLMVNIYGTCLFNLLMAELNP